MSITVRRLVERGYIACRRDRDDARSVALTLTRSGARIREQNTLLDPDLVQEMFSLMSPVMLEGALQGIEVLARYANVLLRKRSRGRKR